MKFVVYRAKFNIYLNTNLKFASASSFSQAKIKLSKKWVK